MNHPPVSPNYSASYKSESSSRHSTWSSNANGAHCTGKSALNIHQQLLRRRHCFWWRGHCFRGAECIMLSLSKLSDSVNREEEPMAINQRTTSETVNRLGADRQDKWCGSECSSPSLPLSLCSLDNPGRSRAPVTESTAVDINTEKTTTIAPRAFWLLTAAWLALPSSRNQAYVLLSPKL